MTLSNLVRAASALFSVGLVATGCSSSPSPPQAFVTVVMSQGTNSGMCGAYPTETTIMQVGMAGNPTVTPPTPPTRVATGAQTVAIACSVAPASGAAAGSFQIDLQISQGDVNVNIGASSFSVNGTVNPTTGGTGLSADVSTTSGGGYSSSNCNVTFDTGESLGTTAPFGAGAEPSGPPVVAGRIWAHVSCPSAQNSTLQTGSGPQTCDIEADVIFENCSS